MDVFGLGHLKPDSRLLVAAAGLSVAAVAGYSIWQYARSDQPTNSDKSVPAPKKTQAIVSSKDFELFDAAVAFVSSPPAGCEFEAANSLGTVGPCTAPEPGMLELDFSKHMKWKAWKALGDMSKADAAIEYTARVDSQAPTWRQAAGLRAELQEHVTGAAPEMPQGDDADGAEEQQQSFDMGPSVSRLDVDALTAEEEQQRESRTSNVVLAVEAGDAESTAAALKVAPSDANAKNEFGESALHLAVNSGNAAVVQLLLDGGAQVDALEDEGGLTPLMYCTFLSDAGQSVAIAQLLLKAGADKSIASEEGTAYEMAQDAEAGEELLQLLQV